MKGIPAKISQTFNQLPSRVCLWLAVLIFAASNSVTRRVIEVGEDHLINGRNPFSLCNVLFVGNVCAVLLMISLFYRDWQPARLKNLTRSNWICLTIIGVLSGAIAPALIFSALDQTSVTNVVLIGRLEPPLTLVLSFYILGSRVNIWSILGSILSFAGVAITAILGNPEGATTTMLGLQVGKGEVFVAIAAVVLAFSTVISKSGLQSISLGIFSTYRTFMGTIIFFVLANILYGSEHFAEAFAPVLWQWMLIYAAIIVVMGQIFWFAGLRSATAAEINLASSFNPILAIAIAYLLLGEVPSAAQYLGGSIIIVGIVLNLIGSVQPTSRVPRTAKLSAANLMDMEKGFKGL